MKVNHTQNGGNKIDSKETASGTKISKVVGQRAPARIKVVGVGGGGCNCVRRMVRHRVPGVSFIMVNTDIKSLEIVDDNVDMIQIGEKVTHGWGAGGDTKMGERAASESSSLLRKAISNSEMVFITAGMGGGTGTGAAPLCAYLAKEMGALVVGVITTPFSFEGSRRLGQAIAGVDRLHPYVDNLIVIHNDRLLEYMDHDSEMVDAFSPGLRPKGNRYRSSQGTHSRRPQSYCLLPSGRH